MAPAKKDEPAAEGGGGSDLRKLEYISLISKVCNELESNVGTSDKVLAEFITDIGRRSATVGEFDSNLKESGAVFPDYFVRSLLTIVHAILSPDPKPSKAPFSGLAIADDRDRARLLEREVEEKQTGERDRSHGNDRGRDRRDRDRDRDDDRYHDSRGRSRHGDGNYDPYDDRGRRERRRDERKEERNPSPRRGRRENGREELELFMVYSGRVSRVMDTGCFVQLNDFRGKEGLVHMSQMSNRRVSNAKDVVKRDQEVFVKVVSISGQKLSLSMRDVDQDTGRDLMPRKKRVDDEALRANPASGDLGSGPTRRIGLSGIMITEEEDMVPSRRPLKRMSSPERWEAKQLIASGVLDVKDFPMFDEDGDGMLYQEEGAEEELEIELNEDEPEFLQGQTRYSIDMSPVKIFKNPEGSLSRAAALQSALIKERREVREQQQRTMLDSIPKDLNRPWEDPMPETGERHLAQELRGVGLSAYDMPEWKKDA